MAKYADFTLTTNTAPSSDLESYDFTADPGVGLAFNVTCFLQTGNTQTINRAFSFKFGGYELYRLSPFTSPNAVVECNFLIAQTSTTHYMIIVNCFTQGGQTQQTPLIIDVAKSKFSDHKFVITAYCSQDAQANYRGMIVA